MQLLDTVFNGLCDVLHVQRRVMGAEHPQTLDTERDLATVHRRQARAA